MSYFYENTSPERFQRFCQSLLISEYPGLQCFPVGQPDGGRDAWHPESQSVLQVKFRRADEEESAEWMISAFEGELPKIRRLVDDGARRYVMVTNARGTAHLGGGRIDKVQAWMDEHIPCPATCLWRDDLDQRFDPAPPTLKFKYAELLTGEDGIQLALAQILGPQRDRQMRVIRSFVATQFKRDATVKFKQVNLSNSLADLFIDIPVRVGDNFVRQLRRLTREGGSESVARKIMVELGPVWSQPSHFATLPDSGMRDYYRTSKVGVAAFLLGRTAQERLTRVVLEGAPGQGKSTLAQFVCQVHRAMLLDRVDFFDTIPTLYRRSGFRVPIKIDLRDLAVFLANPDDGFDRSVDEFISDLIGRESGKQAFSVDDFLDVITSTPTLLFMDGLDEVADLDQRKTLVSAVNDALSRYEAMDVDLQVVVTSRPSIFGKKANFDQSGFITIDLADIDRKLAEDYALKWVKARALEREEAEDVLSIL